MTTTLSRVIPNGYVGARTLRDDAGISHRQLDYWTRAGYLRPATPDHPGSGNHAAYPRTEIAVATLMGRLVRAGCGLDLAHNAARDLVAAGTTRIAGMTIHLPHDL